MAEEGRQTAGIDHAFYSTILAAALLPMHCHCSFLPLQRRRENQAPSRAEGLGSESDIIKHRLSAIARLPGMEHALLFFKTL